MSNLYVKSAIGFAAWLAAAGPSFGQSAQNPPPTLPTITTANIFNVTNPTYGATTNSSNNATAINAAITAASKATGGGTVEIPGPGTYLSGPITLKSKVNLQVDAGATLMMLPYGTWSGTTTFISGSSLTDNEISGSGTIDGQGAAWWAAYNANNSVGRPNFIQFSKCNRILIRDITLQNPPTFHIMIKNSNANITVTNLTINTPYPSPNTDGFDVSSTNVLIENSFISDGDDNVEIGGSALAAEVTVTNCILGRGHGISMGSITSGGVSNILVINCTFTNTDNAIRMKSDVGNGGIVQNLSYYNIQMTGIKYAPILIYSYYNLYGNPTTAGISPATAAGEPVSAVSSTTPVWRNIVISNVTATAGQPGMIWGLLEMPATNIVLDDVNVTGAGAFDLYNVKGLKIIDSQVHITSGSDMYEILNAQATFTNSTTGAASFTMDGLTSTNSLAFYNQTVYMIDSNFFGSTPITVNDSTINDLSSLTLPSSTPVNFGLGITPTTVSVKGDLATSSTLNISDGGGFSPGTYTLFSYTGALSGTPVLGTKPSGYNYNLDTVDTPGEINLIVTSTNPLTGGKMLVTLPGQTYTSGSGNSGTASPQTAGTPFHITLTAVKSDGVTKDTTYTGYMNIAFSGPGGSPTYPTTVAFTNGQNANVPITLTLAQTTTLSAADNANGYTSVASSSLVVNPGAVNGYAVNAGTSQSVGAAFNVTVTAEDANNNVVTNDNTDTVTLSGLGAGTATVNPMVLTAGTATFSVTDNSVEAITITATDENSKSGNSSVIIISQVLPDHFAISAISSPQTAGIAITGVTITAQNASNQTATSFTGTVTYGGTAGISGASAAFTAGVLSGVSVTPTIAGSNLTFTVNASGKTGTATFNVNPGAINSYTVSAGTAQTVGIAFNVTVTAKDANQNIVTTDNSTSVTLSGMGSATATVNPKTLTAGVAVYSVTDTNAETITITATDGNSKTGVSSSITVNAIPSLPLYRSTVSGNWFTVSTWQSSTDGGVTWLAAATAPELSGNNATAVYITNNVTVTNTSAILVSNVTVYAGNTLMTVGTSLTVNSNPGQTNLDVFGTVIVAGTGGSVTNVGTTGNVDFESGGEFLLETITGSGIPPATWNANSTCEYAPLTAGATVPAGLSQTFGNFVWLWPTQNGSAILNGALTNVQGNLDVTAGAAFCFGPKPDTTATSETLTVGGSINVHQMGGNFLLGPGGTENGTYLIQVGKGIIVDSTGRLDMGNNGAAHTGSATIEFTGNSQFTLNGVTVGNPEGGAYIVDSGHTLSLNSSVVVGRTFTVNGTVDFNTNQITGYTNTGSLICNGTLVGNGTNQLTAGLTNIVYGGTLNLGTLPALASGQSFVLFGATTYNTNSAFNGIVPATPGAGLSWNTSPLVVNGSLTVVAGGGAISISSAVTSGPNFVLGGSAGADNANGKYSVLTSTNITLPAASWTVLATGQPLDTNGNFSYTVTNAAGNPQQFYLIKVP
jgi:hypothetical protein